ncbi:MAG TPA: pantoate--beta-alanine ligase [Anaerolineales bacterium]|nr:pantoate--beta-alanine ligase [Anaerolineales bacterium]
MQIFTTLSELQTARAHWHGTLGLVPTMGYLHAGHLALVARAKQENDLVGVSIFVNPTQFAPNEDLSRYPRDLERDLTLLREAGADWVWTPPVEEVYPPNFQTWVEVSQVSLPLEGTSRPGHFRGVATVVAKLFNAFLPTHAYFGQKDAQQTVVIRRMVQDLNFAVKVVICPTVREADGLAMSSRNQYLTPEERAAASVLYRALHAAVLAWQTGERDADILRALMSRTLAGEARAREEYVSVADPDSLQELSQIQTSALFSMAVRLGKTRLIDNWVVGRENAG